MKASCGKIRAHILDGWDDQGAVEKVVVLLARQLGDKHATVAGGAVQEPALVQTLRIVLGADRMVGAETA